MVWHYRLTILATSVVLGLSVPVSAQSDVTIDGAGATFPNPVYSRWASDYKAKTGVKVNYQPVGSGSGVTQIKNKTVDFGASDEPLTTADLTKSGLVQFPMIMGGVVPVINIPGINANDLKLTGAVLADIFQGKIKKWDDPRIAEVNPGLKLPSLAIAVVHRSDGSGTTWLFTNYLSRVSKDWKGNIGVGKAVEWPTGIGGKGNDGVTANVENTKGSIGYVEFAYAKTLATVQLQNKDGEFVSPSSEAFKEAAANADWKNAKNYNVALVNQSGKKSWPITGVSFILMHKEQKDGAKALAVLKFFDWSYKNGEKSALELHYVPLPDNVVKMVQQTWTNDIRAEGKPVWKAE